MTAIDTTVGLTTAQLAALRGAGVTAVSRYIAPQSWKRITPAEATRYAQAGMGLMLNWESGAQDLVTLGSTDTATYARQAVAQAQACGYPAGCAIYVSADWNVTSGQWATVAARLRTIRPIFAAAGYRLGLYAPWDALTWAKRDGLVDYFWQAGMSTSWSGGRNAQAWPGAHLRQRRSTTLAGVDCDINDILIPAFGQCSAAVLGESTTSGDEMLDLTQSIPGSKFEGDTNPGAVDRSLGLFLTDQEQSLNPYKRVWQAETLWNTRDIKTALATAQKSLDALTAAFQAIAASGTNADTAAILAAIKAAGDAESQIVAGLHDQVADLSGKLAELEHKLAAAAQAEAGALAQ